MATPMMPRDGGDPVEKRSWILGDIIHSEPRLIDYIKPATGSLDYRYVVVGANDGMLHVFDDATGDEIFAFIPRTFCQGSRNSQ
jgi:type IV pilus assembly protein PilY1